MVSPYGIFEDVNFGGIRHIFQLSFTITRTEREYLQILTVIVSLSKAPIFVSAHMLRFFCKIYGVKLLRTSLAYTLININTDRQTAGQTDGRTDGRTEGWMDRQAD